MDTNMKLISGRELRIRSKRFDNRITDYFTELGCEALANVITGRLGHPEAIQTLYKMRQVMLDKDGDLNGLEAMKDYCLKRRWTSTDYSWYPTREQHGR